MFDAPSFSGITRRRFLRQLGGGALIAGMPGGLRAEADDLVTVSVLHTTDLHGHITPTQMYPDKDGRVVSDVGGLARCATQIRAWRRENPHHLLLDIGDIYQGTHVSLASRGGLMMRLLNSLSYDAWVIGNHEFDWGPEPLAAAVMASTGKVLGSNAKVEGVYANQLKDTRHPLARIQPYFIREVAGFRIGVIGSITPGLPAWSAPNLLGGFEAAPPVRSVHFALARMRKEGVDAVIVAAHMGLKSLGAADDFANQINDLARKVEGIDCIIAGHTHRDIGAHQVNGVAYTQAGYHGIWCGRVDLVFSRSTRRLVEVRPQTKLMDSSVAQDPQILSASMKERGASDAELARPIGRLACELTHESKPGVPAPALLLLTGAIRHALAAEKVAVDGVLHGNFVEAPIRAGVKTIADAWEIVPYENRLCVAGLTRAEIIQALNEAFNARDSTHNLDGFRVTAAKVGRKWSVTEIVLPDGAPLDPVRRYRIALNSYDAQSGGRRLEVLNWLATAKEAGLVYVETQTREALIGYFTAKGTITAADLGGAGQ